MSAWMPLEEVADTCGTMVWLSDRLFGTWGGWSTDTDDAALRVHFSVASRCHGGHALAWRDQLPTSPQLDAAARVVGPEPWRALFDELDAAGALDSATRRAVACEIVLPALAELLEGFLERSGDVADAPVRRIARAHLADVTAELDGAPPVSGVADSAVVSRVGGTGVLVPRGGC